MKITLNEVKAMNEIAGTQMTKEQEIKFIKDRLQELEFGTQAAFDTYKKQHKMKPDTKVTIAGKKTTVGQASTVKGKSIFGQKQDKEKYTDFSKKYAKLPSRTMGLSGNAAEADGKDFGKIDSEVTYHYYKMKSDKNDLFMSRKQSKQVAKALRSGVDTNIDSDTNDNDDKFPPIKVKRNKDNSMRISTGGKEMNVSKKQSKEIARDIKDSFF